MLGLVAVGKATSIAKPVARSTSLLIAIWLRVAIQQIALPKAGHRAVPGLGRALADVDHVTHDAALALAGVAAGLAQRYGVSPRLVRVLFVASLLLPGPQILAYLALWIIMPKEGRG